MYISILNIENFLEKPDGAKNHDGQKGRARKRADIAENIYLIIVQNCLIY